MANNFVARIISRGRITIPETLREVFDLQDGDLVEVEIKGKVTNETEETGSN